jgi:P63C domain-containing protein
MGTETYLEICSGYVRAMQDGTLTETQIGIAMRAAMFVAACSKVGLIALIDEATGYQVQRPDDELQLKLRLFLLEEMRKWERTFPNELWEQFGRLTHWKGAIHQRPKYWGKLVMELIYEYLDPDVAQWLRENAPRPQKGQNYHQWLTSQYGLRKLIEHIWKLVGIASTCENIDELRNKVEELYGRKPGFQFELRLKAVGSNLR